MSKKMDIELALHEGRYGDLIRYLDKRIDLLSRAVSKILKKEVPADKKTKEVNKS